jgi:hypothetical protein
MIMSGHERGELVKLPKVLIIGDSISMGYTGPVAEALRALAKVTRPEWAPGEEVNCGPTQCGLDNVQAWLGDGQWDVIHFNFGIWDTHLMDAQGGMVLVEDNIASRTDLHQRSTPEQYRKNLTTLVGTFQATGARLIWASTTPIMSRTGTRIRAIPELNEVAAEVMKARNIPIDDLYSYTMPHVAEWQLADQCHFNALGYQELGKQVAQCIRAELICP